MHLKDFKFKLKAHFLSQADKLLASAQAQKCKYVLGIFTCCFCSCCVLACAKKAEKAHFGGSTSYTGRHKPPSLALPRLWPVWFATSFQILPSLLSPLHATVVLLLLPLAPSPPPTGSGVRVHSLSQRPTAAERRRGEERRGRGEERRGDRRRP